jgi:uncharacterized protein (TIGR02118 family)
MVVLSAIYKTPEDTAAFDEHYQNVHTPLVKKVPGLVNMEVLRFSKMITPPTSTVGEQPYMQCNMYFENMDSFKAAMASEENKAAGKDLMGFAGPLVTMCIGEVKA